MPLVEASPANKRYCDAGSDASVAAPATDKICVHDPALLGPPRAADAQDVIEHVGDVARYQYLGLGAEVGAPEDFDIAADEGFQASAVVEQHDDAVVSVRECFGELAPRGYQDGLADGVQRNFVA